MAEYRFYVNRGRMGSIPEITGIFPVMEISDSREGRLLQELVPLAYVPTEIFGGNMNQKKALSIAKRLYNKGHDVTVTDSQRDKKFERVFIAK
ncbi:MAG: hypothetical protein Q8P79_02895 [Nanoarchaeota archaeon]|nr:hypothetical protein [Nanoarchaeota archaeon]